MVGDRGGREIGADGAHEDVAHGGEMFVWVLVKGHLKDGLHQLNAVK